MKRVISFFLTVTMLLGALVIAANAVDEGVHFTDVKDTHWFYQSVAYCVEKGYISGMTETRFAPNDNLTRAQFLTILAKVDGVDLSAYAGKASGFSDVKPSHWYSSYVCWAVEKGITSGISETKFGPNAQVTRAQVARFFYVYTEKAGGDISGRAELSGYPDADKVANWAKDPIAWAVDAGLISGIKKGDVNYLSPNGTATRAQAARMFMQYDSVKTVEYKGRIVCWGDSVTQGIFTGFGDVAEVPYPERVGQILGVEALNYGIGGEIGQQIACRQGGIPFYAYASEEMPFVIPSDRTPVEIDPVLNVDGDIAAIGNNYIYSAVNPMRIAGVLGELTKVEDSNIYHFTRLEKGEEVILTDLARVETFGMMDSREDDITVIWVGHNDLHPADGLPDLLDTIDAMIAACPNDEYIVLGLMGERFVKAYKELNAGIKAHMEELGVGEKFLDVRSYLADPVHLENNNITPTERDEYFISNGWIPASLQAADELHLNQLGYDLLAQYVADKIIELGYLTGPDTRDADALKVETGSKDRVVIFGDSMAQRLEKDPLRNKYLKIPVTNYGIGGEMSEAMARRQGSMAFYVEPVTIPAEKTAVPITLVDGTGDGMDLGHFGDGVSNEFVLSGVKGKVTYTDGQAYFTRNTDGNAVDITVRTRVITPAMQDRRDNDILVIWGGSNNRYNAGNAYKLVEIIEDMVAYHPNDEYVIVGLTSKDYMDEVDGINAILEQAFGEHFVDVREYLMTEQCLIDNGITPTQADYDNMAKGEIPASLLADTIHGNATFYDIVSKMIAQRIKELGYLS